MLREDEKKNDSKNANFEDEKLTRGAGGTLTSGRDPTHKR
jgi:hypothetical protein